jgi:uncharacterized delta-60 repeat protein
MRTTAALALAASIFVFAVPCGWSASGDLDPTFGSNGVAVATFGGASSHANAVVRQMDGKLVAAGTGAADGSQPSAIAVARFDATGALDAGFASGGTVMTEVGAFDDIAVKVMLQSDGKVVVVGSTETAADGSGINIALVRYDTAGALDATFGTGGVASVSLGSPFSVAYGAALQADDKIIVVGAGDSGDEFVARFDTAGALDASFGTGGVVTLDFAGRGDVGRAVVVQPDGYIVVAGTSFNGPLFLDGAVATLTRLDSSGTPDPGFGTGGSVVVSGPNITLFKSLVLQSDGKLVAFGASGPGSVTFKLFRFDSAGVAEGGFAGGPSSFFMTAISSGALAIGGAGEFAMLGDGFPVTRVKTDGTLDADFGTAGHIVLGIGARGSAVATLIEPSGDIILAGSAHIDFEPSRNEMTLVRVLGSSPACTTDQDCGSCEYCNGAGFCAIGSRAGCIVAAARGGKLKIKNRSYSGKSKLTLKWRGTVPAFDPTAGDDVTICVHHAGERLVKAVAPADGTWTGTAPNFSYVDITRTPDGARKMFATAGLIKGGASGPELDATAQGVPQPFNLGSLGPPVLMQLQLGDGACVEATFDTGRRINASTFSGRSD